MTGKPVPRPTVAEVRALLRRRLTEAMKARDKAATSALRSTIAEIDNSEAVPHEPPSTSGGDSPIAGASVGVGATEAPRRELTVDDVRAILTVEVETRHRAAEELAELGHKERAEGLHQEAQVIESVLHEIPTD